MLLNLITLFALGEIPRCQIDTFSGAESKYRNRQCCIVRIISPPLFLAITAVPNILDMASARKQRHVVIREIVLITRFTIEGRHELRRRKVNMPYWPGFFRWRPGVFDAGVVCLFAMLESKKLAGQVWLKKDKGQKAPKGNGLRFETSSRSHFSQYQTTTSYEIEVCLQQVQHPEEEKEGRWIGLLYA